MVQRTKADWVLGRDLVGFQDKPWARGVTHHTSRIDLWGCGSCSPVPRRPSCPGRQPFEWEGCPPPVWGCLPEARPFSFALSACPLNLASVRLQVPSSPCWPGFCLHPWHSMSVPDSWLPFSLNGFVFGWPAGSSHSPHSSPFFLTSCLTAYIPLPLHSPYVTQAMGREVGIQGAIPRLPSRGRAQLCREERDQAQPRRRCLAPRCPSGPEEVFSTGNETWQVGKLQVPDQPTPEMDGESAGGLRKAMASSCSAGQPLKRDRTSSSPPQAHRRNILVSISALC